MKNKVFFPIVLFAMIVGVFASCQRFEMAQIDITQDSYNDTTKVVNYTARVLDDGGCPRCIEAGYCFSYIDSIPSHTCFYSTVVPLVFDTMMTFTDSTQYLTFSWRRTIPFVEGIGGDNAGDTLLYFFRSYITTNAGTFYSTVDTVKVSNTFIIN